MKQEFVYPGSDFDRARTLIALLGSFWARTYTANDQLHSYATATAFTAAQTHRNLLEVVAALSRYTVPLFHKESLVPIVLRRSQRNTNLTSSAKFNRVIANFDASLTFDVPLNSALSAFPLPPNLAAVGQIFNKITFPTVAFTHNADYSVDRENNALVFAVNPFENPGVLKRAITTADGTPDEEITLWGFCGEYDYGYVFNQFAYAVGLKLQTSQGYKDLMNAIFDSLINGGASARDMDLALAAICNIPLVADPQEVIEVVNYDSYGLFIATDKNVYRFAETAEPLVSIGQRVTAGQPLVDGFDVGEFRVGNQFKELQEDGPVHRQMRNDFLVTNGAERIDTEADEDIILNSLDVCPVMRKTLAALALDGGFLASCFYGDLVFENKDVPLHVNTQHRTGYTYVHFALNGLPSDVNKFFDEVHSRGIVLAQQQQNEECAPPHKKLGTLAHILDSRKYAETEPGPQHLPATINPLRFLIENVLRNNVFVVRIAVSALGQKHLGLYNIRHLRQLLPPQTAMIVVFEVAAKPDTISSTQRVTEGLTTFVGMEPAADEMPNANVTDLGATLALISGTCQ
jgi:hypothetical protein